MRVCFDVVLSGGEGKGREGDMGEREREGTEGGAGKEGGEGKGGRSVFDKKAEGTRRK